MSDFLQNFMNIIKRMFSLFKQKDPIAYSAAVAFFTIFSMPSIIIIIVWLARLVQQDEKVRSELINQIDEIVGKEGSEVALTIINNISVMENDWVANIFGLVILFISSTAIFNFIKKGINSIWGISPKPEKGFLKFFTDRIIAFAFIVGLGILIFASLLIDTIFNYIKGFLTEYFSGQTATIMYFLNVLLSIVIITFVFFVIFKFLSDAVIKWKVVLVGALVTSILFNIGKYAIGLILTKANITNTYAAAGSLAAVLIWVFYSSILLFVGGIFTKAYSEHTGREIRPNQSANKIV